MKTIRNNELHTALSALAIDGDATNQAVALYPEVEAVLREMESNFELDEVEITPDAIIFRGAPESFAVWPELSADLPELTDLTPGTYNRQGIAIDITAGRREGDNYTFRSGEVFWKNENITKRFARIFPPNDILLIADILEYVAYWASRGMLEGDMVVYWKERDVTLSVADPAGVRDFSAYPKEMQEAFRTYHLVGAKEGVQTIISPNEYYSTMATLSGITEDMQRIVSRDCHKLTELEDAGYMPGIRSAWSCLDVREKANMWLGSKMHVEILAGYLRQGFHVYVYVDGITGLVDFLPHSTGTTWNYECGDTLTHIIPAFEGGHPEMVNDFIELLSDEEFHEYRAMRRKNKEYTVDDYIDEKNISISERQIELWVDGFDSRDYDGATYTFELSEVQV